MSGHSRLYLDYNAGALDPHGNPNGLHQESRQAHAAIEHARVQVATAIGADPHEIFFFPSASLANYFLAQDFHLLPSPFEHPSIIQSISKTDDKNPTLVSHMLANHETGEIYNIEHAQHSDLSQAFGKIPLNVRTLGLDFATLSAQKIGAGKGAAALYVRGGKYKLPHALGTPNTAAIVSFGEAAEATPETIQQFQQHVKPLRDQLRTRIIAEIPDVIINTPQESSLPNTLHVSFLGAEGESIMLMLDHHGIATSTGSACTTSDGKPSHVIMALHQDKSPAEAAEIAHSSIRFSFPPDAPADTARRIMAALPAVITKLRGIA
ncbi:aminotransferase class V-fold PLP-dependent enzyme [Candidatus Saccharibacteria bacterium]|nr:aminotransferase class V-fold PLP-dependent enzyme [Candidatus Saccharibacteria bacterium]